MTCVFTSTNVLCMILVFIREHFLDEMLAKTRREGECMIWTGTKNRDGYGIHQIIRHGERRSIVLSRIIAAIRYRLDLNDNSWDACHKCDRESCINPDHIYPGNESTNRKDGWNRNPKRVAKKFPKEKCFRGHILADVGLSKRWIREKGRYEWQCKACKREYIRKSTRRKVKNNESIFSVD